MKKFLALTLAASMLAGVADAQRAFRHLGISVEAGTTGAGFNLSYPLVSDHLVLTLGYHLPTYKVSTDLEFNSSAINSKIASANAVINDYNTQIAQHPEAAAAHGLSPMNPITEVGSVLDTHVEAEINFVSYKAMLEWYPELGNTFHVSVGVFVGNGDWATITAQADPTVWNGYAKAVEQNALIPHITVGGISDGSAYEGAPVVPSSEIKPVEGMDKAAIFNMNGETYYLRPNSGGRVDTRIAIQKVKPYIGIGFGRSIPRHRLGCQIELGVYYHGKPMLEYDDKLPDFNGTAYSSKTVDGVVDIVTHLQWYPQINFRISGRLF